MIPMTNSYYSVMLPNLPLCSQRISPEVVYFVFGCDIFPNFSVYSQQKKRSENCHQTRLDVLWINLERTSVNTGLDRGKMRLIHTASSPSPSQNRTASHRDQQLDRPTSACGTACRKMPASVDGSHLFVSSGYLFILKAILRA
jgi:hypothetical protein